MNQFRLDGSLALVTGGGRGIGLGIAKAMKAAGARLILAALEKEEVEAEAAAMDAAGYAVDMRDVAGIGPWYDAVVAAHGRPNVLVNAAGITRRGAAEEMPVDDFNEVLRINVTAVYAVCQAFARHLIGAGEPGAVINLASMMTFASRPKTAAYTASKGAIGQMTKALAVDWADKGIRVNAIAPGFIATKLTEALWRDPEFDAWIRKRTPLARWGTPDDLAWPAVFLASPASAFMTGLVMPVDGGWLATF